jgi:hypothetical protein
LGEGGHQEPSRECTRINTNQIKQTGECFRNLISSTIF